MSRTTNEKPAIALGQRVRTLRRAAGMTQVELADGRFSKQYVSQIERGETPPSEELVSWLADRLGVDRELLDTGFSSADRDRTREALAKGQQLIDEHRYQEALEQFTAQRWALVPEAPEWAYHGVMRGEVWALIRLGRLVDAAAVLAEASERQAGDGGSSVEQAERAYLTAVCSYMSADLPTAHQAFEEALRHLDTIGRAE